MNLSQAPDNMSDFISQAKDFINKAKTQGIDNTGIANTLKFMYDLTQQNIANTKGTFAEQSTAGLQKAQENLANAQAGQYQTSTINQNDFPTGSINAPGTGTQSTPIVPTKTAGPSPMDTENSFQAAKPMQPIKYQSTPSQNPNYPTTGLAQELGDWLGKNVTIGANQPPTTPKAGLSIGW
jgi:hypothetical protein